MITNDTEYELGSCPQDGISSLVFSPEDPARLLVASWDRKVRLYDTLNNNVILVWNHPGPVLDVCFSDGTQCFGVGLEKAVKRKDIETGVESTIGNHTAPISCVKYSNKTGNLFTGGWDSNVCVWDVRSPKCVLKQEAPGKVYSIDIAGYNLVTATSGRRICISDIRSMKTALESRESPLKYMTRKVKCMPNEEGYVIGSVEGRIAVDYFETSSGSTKTKYVFKCHRAPVDDVEYIYPVNALEFFPPSGTFASGGSDGMVNIWDITNKKRIKQYHKFNNEISSLAVNSDCTILAVAASYVYDEGESDHLPDIIHIIILSPNDYRSKTRDL